MELTIKRGDIYYAELNPVIGSEQGGTRPVLIISNDIGNKHSPTVIIAPITSRIHTKAKLPTHTLIKDFDGLDKNSIILFEQIRTIDKQRLREYLGTLDRRFIHCADKALAISIGLAKRISPLVYNDVIIFATSFQRSVKALRMEIFEENTIRALTGCYTVQAVAHIF